MPDWNVHKAWWRRANGFVTAVLLVQGTGVTAQELVSASAAQFPAQQELAQRIVLSSGQDSSGRAPVQSLLEGGLIGGAIGWVLGTVAIGFPLSRAMPPTDDDRSTPGIIIGFEIGQALGIASGVHLANGRRGDFRKSLYLSAAAAALGTALLWTDDFDAVFESHRGQVILVGVPLVQLISSIHAARPENSDRSPSRR